MYANKAAFLDPRRVVEPLAWVGHIPFMFWLIELVRPSLVVELGTHTGNSYCAILQAIEVFNIDAKAVAIDHWKGDEHAGNYSEEVYEELSRYIRQLYGDKGSLLRTTFDEASGEFSDQSIDVLHIDGLHTYEAVKNDFFTWLPKMKLSGIVLFHDTAVTTGDFGVHRLFSELSDQYKTFQFRHSHGLGGVAIGEVPASLQCLFDGRDDEVGLAPQDVFETLGEGLLAKAHAERFASEHQGAMDAGTGAAIEEVERGLALLKRVHERDAELSGSYRSPYNSTGRSAAFVVRKVLASGFFDPSFYAAQSGVSGVTERELCMHYLTRGEAEGLRPSPYFDPALYAEAYPDVAASGKGLLEHFVGFGIKEGRSALSAQNSSADVLKY